MTQAEKELNRIGARTVERAAAIAELVQGARDALGCAALRGRDSNVLELLETRVRDGLSVESVFQAVFALAETIRADAETVENFELPKQTGERRAS